MATDIVKLECQTGVLRAWGTVSVLRPSNPSGIRITRKKIHKSFVKWDLGQFFRAGSFKKKWPGDSVLRKKISKGLVNYVSERQPEPKCAFQSGESREEMYFSLIHYQNWKTMDCKSWKCFKQNKKLSPIFIQEIIKALHNTLQNLFRNGWDCITHMCIFSSIKTCEKSSLYCYQF